MAHHVLPETAQEMAIRESARLVPVPVQGNQAKKCHFLGFVLPTA
jgi:hypothetical protein